MCVYTVYMHTHVTYMISDVAEHDTVSWHWSVSSETFIPRQQSSGKLVPPASFGTFNMDQQLRLMGQLRLWHSLHYHVVGFFTRGLQGPIPLLKKPTSTWFSTGSLF